MSNKIKTILKGDHQHESVQLDEGIARTVCSRDYKDPQRVAQPRKILDGPQGDRVYTCDDVSVTLSANGGGKGAKTGLYAIPKESKTGCKPYIHGDHQGEWVYGIDGNSRTLLSASGTGGKVGFNHTALYAIPKETKSGINTIIRGEHQSTQVYGIDGNSKTLTSAEGGGLGGGMRTGLYAIPSDKEYSVKACITPDRIEKRQSGRRFKEEEEPMFTLTAQDKHGILIYNDKEYYIRKLTPKECFRLQGFSDEDFEKAQKVNSNSQLYKQAGNAVTTNVAYQLGKYILDLEGESA